MVKLRPRIPSDIKISFIYVALGILWILYSNKALHSFVSDSERMNELEVYKGWMYVAITGLLLYILIHKEFIKRNAILRELENAKKKAEESDRLKSAFLANMSHYLRTPMNSILGFVDLLKKRNLNEEKRQRFLNIVNEQSDHLLQFIDNIIEISRLQEGQTVIEIKEFLLSNLTNRINERYLTELECGKGKSINLIYTQHNDNTWMTNDPQKIEFILTNLLSNALKFTEAGAIEFGYELKKGWVEFYVTDSGCGIPKEKQELITKTFMLSDPDVNQQNIGIGLGLAITNGFVKLLKGRLWLEYSSSQGSQFRFVVPVNLNAS